MLSMREVIRACALGDGEVCGKAPVALIHFPRLFGIADLTVALDIEAARMLLTRESQFQTATNVA